MKTWTTLRNGGRAGLVAALSLLSTQPAVASERTARPWAEGVSKERQTTALGLFQEGNKKFAEKAYSEALKTYRSALESWDHPAIRFNIAECLSHLDQYEEAYQHAIASLKYGESGLGPDVHLRAVELKADLERRLGTLVISCAEPGAVVTLDGRKLFTGPGETKVWSSPGPHQVVASKPGHVTQNREETVAAAKSVNVSLELPLLVNNTMMERRWNEWMPWSVVGGSLVVGGLGVLFQLQSKSYYEDYDAQVSQLCRVDGCNVNDLPEEVTSLESSGDTMNVAAIVSYSVAGAGLVTGAVLVLMNRPRPVTSGTSSVSPALGANAGGVWIEW